MADISVDWGAAPVPQDYTAAALQGVQTGQAVRAASALQGINFDDPDSLNKGIGNLVRAGAADQAKALIGLQLQRFETSGRMQSAADAADIYGSPPTQPSGSIPAAPTAPTGPTPDQIAQRTSVINAAQTGIKAIMGESDPTLRKAQYDATAAHLAQLGMDPAYIDHMTAGGTQLDDAHLQSLSDSLGATAAHPDFGGSGQASDLAAHPSSAAYAQAKAPNWLADPRVQAYLARQASYGIDVTPQVGALKEGQGYTGALAPGQEATYGGQPTTQAPFAPVVTNPNERITNPNTGATIAENPPLPVSQEPGHPLVDPRTGATIAAAPPYKLDPQVVPKGNDLYNVNTNPQVGQAGAPRPELRGALVADPEATLGAILGGKPTITSTERSAKHNAEVGGSPTSEHIPGNGDGIDFSPPKGMTTNEAIGRLVASGVPFDQIINEGSVVHVGFGNGTPRGEILTGTTGGGSKASVIGHAPLAMGSGNGAGAITKLVEGQYVTQGTAPGIPGQVQIEPNHTITRIPGTGLDTGDETRIRDDTLAIPQVQQSKNLIAAFNGLKTQLPTMTGPAAYAAMNTLFQTVNPNTAADLHNANALKNTFGITDQIANEITRAFNQGTLTPQIRQEMVDAAYGFVKSHYDQAKSYVDSQRSFITQRGGNSNAVDGILDAPPLKYYVQPPPASARIKGTVIDTPKGPRVWSGTGWVAAHG